MPTIRQTSHALTDVGGACVRKSIDDVIGEESRAAQVDNLATRARIHERKTDNLIVQANC